MGVLIESSRNAGSIRGLAAISVATIGVLWFVLKQGNESMAPVLAWSAIAAGLISMIVGRLGLSGYLNLDRRTLTLFIGVGLAILLGSSVWLLGFTIGVFDRGTPAALPASAVPSINVTQTVNVNPEVNRASRPEVAPAAAIEHAPENRAAPVESDVPKAAPALEKPTPLPATQPAPRPLPPRKLAVLRVDSNLSPNPLESALGPMLRELHQPAGENNPAVEVNVSVLQQRNPPKGTAYFNARIDFRRAGGEACSFQVFHEEQRYSSASPVFQPANLQPVVDEVLAELLLYASGRPEKCQESVP